MANRSNCREIIVNGQKFDSIGSAARTFGVSRNTLDYRLSKGWTPEQAVGIEPRPRFAASTAGRTVIVEGHEFDSIRQAAKFYGRSYTYIFSRLKEGCSLEKALGLIKRNDTLLSEYPELVKQWHPTKNKSINPNDVTPGSGKKVWWKCSNGHEWEAVINSRVRGMGCPYCSGQLPTSDRNLATEYPELLKEWDWEKNVSKKPEYLTPRSGNKVWWQCEKGHSWQATISNRTRNFKNSTCPYCSKKKLCEENSLAKVRPDLAGQWHPTKNKGLTAKHVVAGGSKKVWWICKHGHEWQATIKSRVHKGTGCPKCSLQTSRIEIAVYSEVDALFDNTEWRKKIEGIECDIFIEDYNIGIEIDGVYWHKKRPHQELEKSTLFEAKGIQLFRLREDDLPLLSNRDISYKSSEDEYVIISRLVQKLLLFVKLSSEKEAKLREYVKGKRLINEKIYRKMVANLPAPPPGQSLADKYPEIAREWAYDLNVPLLPEHFWPSANKKVWWRCSSGHTWKTTMNLRVSQGTGCPTCPRHPIKVNDDRNFASYFPNLAKEWHPYKNQDLKPEDVRPRSNRKVWWQCKEGHEWEASISPRANGSGCPYCYGRYATISNNLACKYPELLEEWNYEKNKELNPSEITPHVNIKVWWKCNQGHSWQATIYNRAKNKSGCPTCYKENTRMKSLKEMKSIAEKYGGKCLSEKYTNRRTKLKWTCINGHIWEANAETILYEKKWCPECLTIEKKKGSHPDK